MALRLYSGTGLSVRYSQSESDDCERHRCSVNSAHRRPLLYEVRALRAALPRCSLRCLARAANDDEECSRRVEPAVVQHHLFS
jgi:hypothetical protein